MRLLLILALTMPLTAGSCLKQAPPIEKPGPEFCDVEDPRRFTRTEWNYRVENFPDNLAKDIRTNLTWDRECKA